MIEIENSDAYQRLLKAVEHDEKQSPGFHDYRGKLAWILERAAHYAEKLGLDACAILSAWEASRDYWYMNYYQDANQPKIENDAVRVFETVDEMQAAIGKAGFRCPCCSGVSRSPYECDSGLTMPKSSKVCDWKSYGLFGTAGKGVFIFVKEKLKGESIFMPIAWEEA